MIKQIKSLLGDAQLQQQVKQANSLAEAIKLVLAAGASKGYDLSKEAVSQALANLASMQPNELTEEDLLAVSGGFCGPITCLLSSHLMGR